MWNNIVQDKKLEKRIIEKINALADAVCAPDFYQNDGALIGHSGGSILMYSYLNQFMHTDRFNDPMANSLEASLGHPTQKHPLTYSTGTLGILYLVDHLRINQLIELDEPDPGIEKNFLRQYINGSYFDFMHGTGGLVNYLLQNKAPEHRDLLQDWVNVLEKLGRSDEQNIKWDIQYGPNKEEFGECFGLAHGVPNLIILLAKIAATYGIDTKLLIEKACNNLLSFRNPAGERSMFPQFVSEGVKKNPARLAWCYGDLGCALSLYFAGKALNNKKYTREAMEIFAFNTQRRDLEDSRIADGAFCHGSVGVAHVFARMYNYTGNESFRETAEYWYNTTLDYAHHTDGVSGFKSFSVYHNRLENDVSLLEGTSGIGLSLISAVSQVEPKWDSCFLLS